MARKSRLPEGGVNLFQKIKAVCTEAEEGGQTLYRLSIGQPTGPALEVARRVAAQAILSDAESMHEYQDNGSPGIPFFAERFVGAHVNFNVDTADVRCLPIPGIKPMLGLIPLACSGTENDIRVLTTVKPGYPTPADWCDYLQFDHQAAILSPANNFRFDAAGEIEDSGCDLIMANYPHNASAAVATQEWWASVCKVAQEKNVRIFNDAAYSILAHTKEHCTLADVAVNFPDLSWAEAFSASKAGNFTGWRIGAIVGSPDFVDDIATIKGNTDSGFVAPMAAGILTAFENHRDLIDEVRLMYHRRIELLVKTMTAHGMRLAVQPDAGFFTLWKTPTQAFGQKIESAEHFNSLMIKNTGVVGVYFEPYTRYAVCGDVKAMIEPIDQAFKQAAVSYDD